MSNANNQFNFLDYSGLSLFWSKVKKIISDNESATTTSLNNLNTKVNNLETKVADQKIPLSVGSVSTAVQQETSTASGEYSFAEGYYTNASNTQSHAEGARTVASGQASHAEGGATEAKNRAEHAEGMFNISIQDKTIHTVGIGLLNDNKNAHEIHVDGKHYIFGIGGYDGTNSQTEGIKTVQEVISDIQDKMINISYNDLVALRNNSKLVPGQQYRITDYTCTTTQAGTTSAGHVFDIIVAADSGNKLNEEARAIQHAGDTYFADCNLSAWKIWYCLDNDYTRFDWALVKGKYIKLTNGSGYYLIYIDDIVINETTYERWYSANRQFYFGITSLGLYETCYKLYYDGESWTLENEIGQIDDINDVEGGKGVIYRMIDEWNNDCPYDFKNIQFDGSWGYYAYTFNWINNLSNNSCEDLSVAQYVHTTDTHGYTHTYGNIIKPHAIEDNNGASCFQLNKCVFLNTESYDGGFFYGCYSNTFGNDCYSNTFENYCCNNTFGNKCYDNTFGNAFDSNTFGNECYDNTFGDDCYYNSFGNHCYTNSFGNNYKNNSFGNDCTNNSFGNNCTNNSFGNSCRYNVFGNNCSDNSLGNNCFGIKFASGKTDSSSTKYNYYRNNHFGDGCQYILFTGTETASSSQQVQNYNFAQGLQGTSSAYLTIPGLRNKAFDITISKDSSGNVYSYCLANVARQLGANLIS